MNFGIIEVIISIVLVFLWQLADTETEKKKKYTGENNNSTIGYIIDWFCIIFIFGFFLRGMYLLLN